MSLTKFIVAHVVKVMMVAKENVTAKVSSVVKVAVAAKAALEVAAHVASAMAFVQTKLKRTKTANAQLGFFESSSKLL
jgi:hypothetical protein